MSEKINPSSSLRLLVKNAQGREIAIPLSDDLVISAGVRDYSHTGEAENSLRALGVTAEDLEKNSGIVTLNRGAWDDPVVLSFSIKEIFALVAKAQKSQDPLVDLTAGSGTEALIKKFTKTSPRTMGGSSPGIDDPVQNVRARRSGWHPKG